MYLPPHFVETDAAEVAALIAAFPLAALVAQTEQGLIANHIPVIAQPDGSLIGHVALGNDMHRLIGPKTEVIAMFRGEDSYISPNWYPTKAVHHRHVPTWNYQVVHLHGHLAFSHDDKSKRAAVGRLTQLHEGRINGAEGWRMADAPPEYMALQLDGIVAFRMTVTRVLAKTKLSQNRDDVDFAAVADRLNTQGSSDLARRMAGLKEGDQPV